MTPAGLIVGTSCRLFSQQSIKDNAKFDSFADTQSQENLILDTIKAGDDRQVIEEPDAREVCLLRSPHSEFSRDYSLCREELYDRCSRGLAEALPLPR